MKFNLSIFLIYAILFNFLSCAQSPKEPEDKRIKVAFLIYPEIAVLDYTGPMDAFVKANRMTDNSYDIFTVSKSTETIQTQGHVLETHADYSFENAPQADILIIPGAKIEVVEALGKNVEYTTFIKQHSKNTEVTMSVCTGSFILGELGMLDGLKATTHWIYGNKFTDDFPKLELVKDIRFVDQGSIITTSGVTTGIDGAIHLIEKYSGSDIAAMISRGLQYKIDLNQKWPEMSKEPMTHGDSVPLDN